MERGRLGLRPVEFESMEGESGGTGDPCQGGDADLEMPCSEMIRRFSECIRLQRRDIDAREEE